MEMDEVASIEDKDRDGLLKSPKHAASKEINIDIVDQDPMKDAVCVTGWPLFGQRLLALCKIRYTLIDFFVCFVA